MRLAAIVLLSCLASPALAAVPYPPNPFPCGAATDGAPPPDPACIPATEFGSYLYLPTAEPPVLPPDWPADDWKLTSAKTGEAAIDGSAQELYGIKGASVDRAWQVSTGRPDVVIAVLDSGIRWAEPLTDLVGKFYLNRAELPVPQGSSNGADPHDRNADGLFTVRDYEAVDLPPLAADSRVSDLNGNGLLDPEDLIFAFSDGVDDDANGYVDDISGWDFFEDDNDALDEVRYGHGTGESHDSGAEGGNGEGIGVCPNCLLLEVRVGDSFVTDVNLFAQGVVFAVDSGVRVVQEALGTLNQTEFGQQAVDYAWRNGVIVVASAADESSNHHNYPANYNHTLEVNSVVRYFSQSGIEQSPRSHLYLNGCTNYGGHIHLAVPSSSCSSEATGLGSGMAALVVSAAQNAVDAGTLARYPRDDGSSAPFALSGEEVRQILISTADDINFDARDDVEPPLPQNYVTRLPVPGSPGSTRYPSIAGWDQFFGYGRINADRALRRVAAGQIPPEAALEFPAWFDIVDPGPEDARNAEFAVLGRVAANRAGAFSYVVDVAPGVQPAEGDFVPVGPAVDRQSAFEGRLGGVDLSALVARMPHGVEGPAVNEDGSPDPDRFSFTVRLRVTDEDGLVAEDRRTLALHHDAQLVGGLGGDESTDDVPLKIRSDGVSAPVTADLDGDGHEDLLFGTSSGLVIAFQLLPANPPLTEPVLRPLPGWRAATSSLELHQGSRAYALGHVATPVHTAILGPIAVGDLDRDGTLEVVAADMQGRVYVWDRDAKLRPGFPVQTLAEYSNSRRSERDLQTEEGRVPDKTNRHDRDNSVARGIVGGVSLGNLDGSADGSLEIVAGALDRHVYAWHHDGTPVHGWPVLVKDPDKVADVDPVTNEVTLKPGANATEGTKIVAAPSLGDLDNDGDLEVLTVTNEAYREGTNALYTNLFVNIFIATGVLDPGNSRVYAIHADGAAHGGSGLAKGWNPAAFVAGWPVKTSLLQPELLPFVGEGGNGPPALADVDGDGTLEVATFAAVGPAYLFRHDGTPYLGAHMSGEAVTFGTDVFGALSPAVDTPSFAALGAPVLAELAGVGTGFQLLAPSAGFGKLLDNQLPARQAPAENHLAAWDVAGSNAGKLRAGFPQVVNDLMFFGAPAVADLDSDGSAEAIIGSGSYDLHAFSSGGAEIEGWPKFTGGWSIGSPTVGDLDGDGYLEVISLTREGRLFVWRLGGRECSPVPWRRWHHDEWGTGNAHTDARPPGPALLDPQRPLRVEGFDTAAVPLLAMPADDLYCGEAATARVKFSSAPIDTPAAFAAATEVEATAYSAAPGRRLGELLFASRALGGQAVYVAAAFEDDAGNRSPIVQLGQVSFPPGPTATATSTSTTVPTPTATVAATATLTPTAVPSADGGGGCNARSDGGSASAAVVGLLALLLVRLWTAGVPPATAAKQPSVFETNGSSRKGGASHHLRAGRPRSEEA